MPANDRLGTRPGRPARRGRCVRGTDRPTPTTAERGPGTAATGGPPRQPARGPIFSAGPGPHTPVDPRAGQASARRALIRWPAAVVARPLARFGSAARLTLLFAAIAGAAGPGCGGGGSAAPPVVYTLGGTVSGLAPGGALTLAVFSDNTLKVSANGAFTFVTPLVTGTPYTVTVQTPPGGETCTVSNASGAIAADVSNVQVSCSSAVSLIAVAGTGASAQGIAVYALATAFGGASPQAIATLSAPLPVLGAVLDQAGNLYYLGSAVANVTTSFYTCSAASSYASCTPSAAAIAGNVSAMTIDGDGNVYVATVQNNAGQVLKFAAGAGPGSPSVVYQSRAGFPVLLGLAVTADGSMLYVVEAAGPVVEGFGPSGLVYQCPAACQTAAATSATQTDITASVGAPGPLAGPVAVDASGALHLGLVNPDGDGAAPATMPIAAACSGANGIYSCTEDDVTFPLVAGNANPFVQALAIAVDSAGNEYIAIALDGSGTPLSQLGPQFFEFTPGGNPLSCGGASCTISQLPAALALAVVP